MVNEITKYTRKKIKFVQVNYAQLLTYFTATTKQTANLKLSCQFGMSHLSTNHFSVCQIRPQNKLFCKTKQLFRAAYQCRF